MKPFLLLAPLLLGAAPPPGTIAVEPATGEVPPAVAQTFAAAARDAFAQAGFVPLPGVDLGRYLARLEVTREARGTVTVTDPRTSSDFAAGNWTAGMRVTLPSEKTQLRTLYATRLRIVLLRRGEPQPLWSGEAITVQPSGTRDDAPAALAAKLARVIVSHYPAQSDTLVSVP